MRDVWSDQFIEVARCRTVENLERQEQDLIQDTETNRKPVKILENGRYMLGGDW